MHTRKWNRKEKREGSCTPCSQKIFAPCKCTHHLPNTQLREILSEATTHHEAAFQVLPDHTHIQHRATLQAGVIALCGVDFAVPQPQHDHCDVHVTKSIPICIFRIGLLPLEVVLVGGISDVYNGKD